MAWPRCHPGTGTGTVIEGCFFGFSWGVQSLDRVTWPRCPLRHREVFFRFCMGCTIARPDGLAEVSTQVCRGVFGFCMGCATARPGVRVCRICASPKTCRTRLRQPCPASIISAPCGRLPGALRSRRRLAEARQGRASAAGVAAQIHGQAMRPWLSTPSCRRPYGAQPPNRPVIQSQTRAKKPEVSSVSASGSGVGAGETFGI